MHNQIGKTLLSRKFEKVWNARLNEFEGSAEMAALFRGWIPAGFGAKGKPRILYVGKATSGRLEGAEPEKRFFNGRRAFWTFARRIEKELGQDDELSSFAWSNISKIHVAQVRADQSVIQGFELESIDTLESEIKLTKPHVVVFVTGHFSDLVVNQIAEANNDRSWKKSEDETSYKEHQDIWWKSRKDKVIIVWMRHPEGPHTESLIMKLEYAAAKIADIVKLQLQSS